MPKGDNLRPVLVIPAKAGIQFNISGSRGRVQGFTRAGEAGCPSRSKPRDDRGGWRSSRGMTVLVGEGIDGLADAGEGLAGGGADVPRTQVVVHQAWLVDPLGLDSGLL